MRGNQLSIRIKLFWQIASSIALKQNTPPSSFIFLIRSLILLEVSIELIASISVSVKLCPVMVKVKLVVLPALKRVELPPICDFMLKPNVGVIPVLRSWITIVISFFCFEPALILLQWISDINCSISGIAKVPFSLWIMSSSVLAFLRKSATGLRKSSFPSSDIIMISPSNAYS